MTRVVFFTEDDWAFGSIHHGLAKEMFKHNIHGHVLDIRKQYTATEIGLVEKSTDFFMATPQCAWILHDRYNVPAHKIIVVSHGRVEFYLTQHLCGDRQRRNEFFEQVHKYAVVCDWLVDHSKQVLCDRKPCRVTVGVHTELFRADPATSLSRLGYGGAPKVIGVGGTDIKRKYLVEEVSEKTSLPIITYPRCGFRSMPGYYQDIDCLVVSSLEETVCLPVMEAAAAGRMVISTNVGYVVDNAPTGSCVVPWRDSEFVEEVTSQLRQFVSDRDQFAERCQNIQTYAQKHYDWSVHIQEWVRLFS